MNGLLVNRLLPRIGPRPPSRHSVGLPPELTGGLDERVVLGHPAILAVERDNRGQIFLYRYASDGTPVGDTWHESVEDALHQAEAEYAEILGSWDPVPGGRDPVEFALSLRD